MACKTHTDHLVIIIPLFFCLFVLVENKDSDVSTEQPSGNRTEDKRRQNPRRFFLKYQGLLLICLTITLLFLLLHLFTTNVCAFHLGSKMKVKLSPAPSPNSGQFIANEVRTCGQQHTLQYGTSISGNDLKK